MQKIDCTGLACPRPVLMAKQATESADAGPVTLIVDNLAAKENVSRFLALQGYEVEVSQQEGSFEITGRPGSQKAPKAQPAQATGAEKASKILIFCPTDRIGFGDDELGRKLLISFIKTVNEMGPDLWRLVLVNNGVKLATTGSPVLEDLQKLADSGISILVCGTCLTHFDLMDKKQVGQTTNMLDIITSMQLADKVISL
ncbi:MAG: sulfurtransferase-like selenium metabolism protein YedF [Desulfatibacillaceae bacterium]|nr:sulfurtransferase-like selenium metabolism protein YedF [Desulfatibacillaceae bacterium]